MKNKIQFNINGQKTLEVILYLANKFINPTVYQVVKLVYFADIYHLNEYGRPVVGDRYVAMDYGPVASTTYDIIKLDPMASEWASGGEEIPFKRNDNHIIPTRKAREEYLSKSDIKALDYAFDNYKDYSFKMFKDETHEHSAWLNARKNSLNNSPPMDYADLIKSCNQDLKEHLLENASSILL